MNFTPKSEGDLRTFEPAPDGEYDFDVLEAAESVSKSGNDMIKLNIGLYNIDGERIRWRVFDYLLPSAEYKLRHFCDSTGLLSKYEAGTLQASDCVGRSGKCKVVIEKDKTGQYADKNVIRDYTCRPAKPIGATSSAPANASEDDGLPF